MQWSHHSIDRLPDWLPAWRALLGRTSGTPLLAPEFVQPLLEQFGDGRERLVCCGTPDAPVALGILARSGRFGWETFQPAQAPLGIWLQDPRVDFADLLPGLMRALPGVTLMLGVTQQDPLFLPRPAPTGVLETLDYIRTAWVPIQGTFDAYWDARGKNLRQNMKKQRNKLEKAGVVTRLEALREPGQMAQAVADYGRLESASWKAEGGTAVNADNAQGRFYQAMLENFCRIGQGVVYRYYYGDQLAATDLCVEGGGALIVLKTTYDESIADGTSPALLMRQDAFANLFAEQRIGRVEFYGRVMEWHTRWTDESRTLYHLNAYRSGILPKLARLVKNRTSATEPTAASAPA